MLWYPVSHPRILKIASNVSRMYFGNIKPVHDWRNCALHWKKANLHNKPFAVHTIVAPFCEYIQLWHVLMVVYWVRLATCEYGSIYIKYFASFGMFACKDSFLTVLGNIIIFLSELFLSYVRQSHFFAMFILLDRNILFSLLKRVLVIPILHLFLCLLNHHL